MLRLLRTDYVMVAQIVSILGCVVIRVFAVGCLLWGAIQLSVSAALAQADYELAAGDVVEFDFLDDDLEPRQLTIGNDGRIQMPLIGGLKIAGLRISDAIEEARRQYVERQLLLDPKINLAIAVYRPIFVLGDVRSPGVFPFGPFLTVEKAVGLAGGPASALTSAEDRILARSRLQGELGEIDASIAREAVWQARLLAQLDDRRNISFDDIPKTARPLLSDLLLGGLIEMEERILNADTEAHQNQRFLIAESIAESDRELSLLEEMVENQRKLIEFSREELERGRGLLERGLKTQTEVTGLERQTSAEESRLLDVLAQRSRALRGSADMKRSLAQLDDDRRRDALLAMQARQVEIEKLLVRRRSAEDQLALITNWASAEARGSLTKTFTYDIRRREGGELKNHTATSMSELLPGDVLVVTIAPQSISADLLQ